MKNNKETLEERGYDAELLEKKLELWNTCFLQVSRFKLCFYYWIARILQGKFFMFGYVR